jgi:glycosyltransferase involved in cell wall biosynthesis
MGGRNVRVAYIHQYFATREMSGGTRSFELARRLVADGHEVHVVTTDASASRASRSWRTTTVDGIVVHWLPVPYSNEMTYGRRIRAFLRFAMLSGLRAASVRPDVVLATSTPLTVALPGILAARLRRAPFVFEVRDLWPELPIEIGALRHPVTKRLAKWLARIAYRNAAQVIALSPGMADGVAAYGYPRSRITVVPNACDLDLFDVHPDDVRRFRQARSWLQDRPLVLYAGEGREVETTRQLAADLGVLDETVFFEPPVPKAAMPAVLGAATLATSVFVPLPGMRANSANKFFDALAAGRPIALNYGGWQAELLDEYGAGIELDAHDIDTAAAQLVSKLNDAQWLHTAGLASRQLATERFSRDETFAAFEHALLGNSTDPRLAPQATETG